jgi:tetratricopeptide (TPR) repeat protein
MENQSPTQAKPFFNGEPFEQFVAILIAVVTIIASIVGYLQVDADNRSNQALRTAQAFAIQAVELKASGKVQSSAWTDVLRLREEVLSLAIIAENYEDPKAAERFRAAGEQLLQLSPVLAPPYFDPAGEEAPNQAKFESDSYFVEATYFSERFADAFAIKGAWGDKADAYIAHLTLLAVTLFFFGISITLPGRMRWAFVGMGGLFTVATLIWVLIVFFTPVTAQPDEAMRAYADGEGWIHQDEPEKAVEAYNQAIAADPAYTNAYVSRAYAHEDLGQYDQAIADFEKVRAAGYRSSDVLADLSWLYYLKGQFPEAISLAQAGIEQYPAEIIHHINLGQAQLASNNPEAAQAAYNTASDLATRQVAEARAAEQEPPETLWIELDEAALDLDGLSSCIEAQDNCDHTTPPFETVSGINPVKGRDLSLQLRNFQVALEYTGKVPGPAPAAKVTPFEFAQPVYDEETDELIEYNYPEEFPDSASFITFFFDYEGMKDGQNVVYKVYYNFAEDPALRLVEEWSLGESGEAEFTLSYGELYTFPPGDYWVEMYVDSHLVQEGGFTVVAEGEAQLAPEPVAPVDATSAF